MTNDSKSKTDKELGDADSPSAPVASSAVAPQAPNSENVLEELRKDNLELQAELKKREDMLIRMNELRAREMISGRGKAGIPVVDDPKTEKKKAAMNFFEGTDIARAIERHG